MKNYLLIIAITLLIGVQQANAQTSCSEMIRYVKSNSSGLKFTSYGSDAISQVTFYEFTDRIANRHYYAIVRFTSSNKDYIYQVASGTKSNYSLNYSNSAGKAFWKYIEPYKSNLNCGIN